MPWIFLILLLVAPLGAEEYRSSTVPLTLEACYRLALARSETVALSEEEIRRSEARYQEVRSQILPRVGFLATERILDASDSSGGDNGRSSRRDRPEASLYARQPLFHGFRELAAIQAKKSSQEARTEDLDQARLLLLEDVALLFYEIVREDSRIQTIEALQRASEERLTELRRRVAIGRSRTSEVLSSRTQSARLEADLEEARSLRAAAGEILSSLLGVRVDAVSDRTPDAQAPLPLEGYLARVARRPDVRAADRDAASFMFAEKSVRRSYWPTLDVGGNYFLERVGPNEDIDWEVLFALDFPFYRGGEYRGQVGVAESERRSAEVRASLVRRLAERDIRTRHQDLQSALARWEKLSEAARLAEENYRSQRDEYRLGLVTNLDVLAALNSLEELRLESDRMRLLAKLVAVRLGVAVNDRPEVQP